jgi:hypothetical protein
VLQVGRETFLLDAGSFHEMVAAARRANNN